MFKSINLKQVHCMYTQHSNIIKKSERNMKGGLVEKKCKILLDRQLGTITCLWAQPIDDHKPKRISKRPQDDNDYIHALTRPLQ